MAPACDVECRRPANTGETLIIIVLINNIKLNLSVFFVPLVLN